jgi:hypothetical protein
MATIELTGHHDSAQHKDNRLYRAYIKSSLCRARESPVSSFHSLPPGSPQRYVTPERSWGHSLPVAYNPGRVRGLTQCSQTGPHASPIPLS